MTDPYVSVAVEGRSDAAAAQVVLGHVGLSLAKPCVVRNGSANLDKIINTLAGAQPYNPWIVFRDCDRHCPVELSKDLLRSTAGNPCFQLRLARPMMEAWLLADRTGFSAFFKVAETRIPSDPDALDHAKRTLITLCGTSRSRQIREELCRTDGRPGPLYVDWISRFARQHWDVARAAAASESLRRAVHRLCEMREHLLKVQALHSAPDRPQAHLSTGSP